MANLLESAGFSRANPYYIVQQGKVCRGQGGGREIGARTGRRHESPTTLCSRARCAGGQGAGKGGRKGGKQVPISRGRGTGGAGGSAGVNPYCIVQQGKVRTGQVHGQKE